MFHDEMISIQMPEGMRTFTGLAQLRTEAKVRSGYLGSKLDETREAYRALGLVLIELKKRTASGEWLRTLRQDGIHIRRAQRAMRMAGGKMDGMEPKAVSREIFGHQI